MSLTLYLIVYLLCIFLIKLVILDAEILHYDLITLSLHTSFVYFTGTVVWDGLSGNMLFKMLELWILGAEHGLGIKYKSCFIDYSFLIKKKQQKVVRICLFRFQEPFQSTCMPTRDNWLHGKVRVQPTLKHLGPLLPSLTPVWVSPSLTFTCMSCYC